MNETRNYEVTGKSKYLNDLERLFGLIEYWGNIGHSGNIMLFIDGDGACRLQFDKKIKEDIPEDFRFTFESPHHELDETVESRGTAAFIYFD